MSLSQDDCLGTIPVSHDVVVILAAVAGLLLGKYLGIGAPKRSFGKAVEALSEAPAGRA